MCISPVRIRNPNYHSKNPYGKYKDISSAYINVPCGHCCECVSVRQMSFTQRVQMESLDNHIFFATLTYNDDAMPVVETSTGFRIKYVAVDDLQKMMKRLRKSNAFGRSFRYCGVTERGSVRGRPHVHLLFFVPKQDDDDFNRILNLERVLFDAVRLEWRRNLGSTRKPIWQPLFTFRQKMIRGRLNSNYDLHYVNPRTSDNGELDVAFYVSKYMIKPSDKERKLQQALHFNLPLDEYYKVWNLVKSRYFSSVGFGYNNSEKVREYIRSCVADSLVMSNMPCFYNKDNGKSFPLSRYYKSKGDLYSVDDAIAFWNKSHPEDNVSLDDSDITEKLRKIEKFNHRVDLMDSHDKDYLFNEIYE